MGKRYFCDYCNTAFADNLMSRRNHLKSVQHYKNKQIHYYQFKDAATKLQEDSLKIPCKKFSTSGCHFGQACRFSHISAEELEQLKKEALDDREKKMAEQKEKDKEISLDDWLRKHNISEEDAETAEIESVPLSSYRLPLNLQDIQNLPPSVLPPPAYVPASCITEWG